MLGYIIGGFFAASVLPGVMAVGWRLIQPKLQGLAGESMVNRCLRKFKGRGFARAKNIMIPSRDKTAQIDNLLISRYGIFVVETKNYVGTVTGDAHSAKWEQALPGRKRKTRSFQNPIWQNYGHIKALQQLLGRSYPNLKYHNIVVFSDACQPPSISGVVTFSKLKGALLERMKGTPVLSNEDVAAIKECIEKNNIKDIRKRREHVAHARAAASQTDINVTRKRRRRNVEADKAAAMRVQMAYSYGPLASDGFNPSVSKLSHEKPHREVPSLSSQIQTATTLVSQPRSDDMAPAKESTLER